jgi:hypothetical protein
MDEVLPCVKQGLCAAVYTQVSDVEDEINGLLSYDRKVEKLSPEEMLPVAQALQKAIEAHSEFGSVFWTDDKEEVVVEAKEEAQDEPKKVKRYKTKE